MSAEAQGQTARLTRLALMTAAALALHVAESWFPVVLPGVPGVKLGLANSVTLLAMLLLGPRDALAVAVLRVSLGSLLGGGAMAGLRALFRDGIHTVSVSVAGAMAHNAGQLVVAVVFSGWYVFSYFPVLLLSAVATGAAVGVCVELVRRPLERARRSQ